jgi:lipid-binding SYLF domain-containing protein
MKRTVFTFLAVLLAAPSLVLTADSERLKDAGLVLTEMAGMGDAGIPTSLIAKSRCIVIIPSLKKAAFVVGGQYGRGYMSCRKDGSWSGPAGIRVEGGSVGFQIGGSATDVVLLVMNERGVDKILGNEFKVGADASVAAGPIGREASAQTDITMRAEMLAWSRSRGVFAGVALQGSTLREDSGENKELYGKAVTNREIVTGQVAAPKVAEDFLKALSKY